MKSWDIIIPSNHGIALRISNYLKIKLTNVAAYETLLVGFILMYELRLATEQTT